MPHRRLRPQLLIVLTLASVMFASSLQGQTSSPHQAPSRPGFRQGYGRSAPHATEISSLGLVYGISGSAGYLIDAPGLYVVTNDLEVNDLRFGIVIESPDVILDLGGHTLHNPSGTAYSVVRIERPNDVIVRNGRLSGGLWTIVGAGCIGDHGRDGQNLTLHHLSVDTPHQALLTGCVDDITIRDSEFIGNIGLQIPDAYRVRITNNLIQAEQFGIIWGADDGVMRHNMILGGSSSSISGDRNDLRGNTVTGYVLVEGQDNRVLDNAIDGTGADFALQAFGPNLIRGNVLRGGTYATLLLRGSSPVLRDNAFIGHPFPVRVEGAASLIDGNRFTDDILQCAINYTNSSDHVYRNNIVSSGADLACGQPNIDGGGNVFVEP